MSGAAPLALEALAAAAPAWLGTVCPPEWVVRYGRRFEQYRLPHKEAERDALARTIGEDGFRLLSALETAPPVREAEAGLGSLPGGGAEVFADRVRRLVAPGKEHPDNWFHVHRTAHGLGRRRWVRTVERARTLLSPIRSAICLS